MGFLLTSWLWQKLSPAREGLLGFSVNKTVLWRCSPLVDSRITSRTSKFISIEPPWWRMKEEAVWTSYLNKRASLICGGADEIFLLAGRGGEGEQASGTPNPRSGRRFPEAAKVKSTVVLYWPLIYAVGDWHRFRTSKWRLPRRSL
jgi:hypothetical protein